MGMAQAVLRQPASASPQERGGLGPQDTHHPPLFKLRPQAMEDLVFPWFTHPRGQYSVHAALGVSSAQSSGWAGGPQNGWRGQMGLGPGGSPCRLLLWAAQTLFSLQAAMREGGQQRWNHPQTKKWQHVLLKEKRRWSSLIVGHEKQTSTARELTHRCHCYSPRVTTMPSKWRGSEVSLWVEVRRLTQPFFQHPQHL